MNTLENLLAMMGDLGPDVSLNRHSGALVFTGSSGTQVVARADQDGRVTVSYEEAPHVLCTEICPPPAGAQFIRRLLKRTRLEKLELNV